MASKKNDVKKSNRILIFLFFVVLIGMIAGALLSPAFDLSEVAVKDGTNITKEEIYNIVDIKYGENIFRQSYTTIKSSVMKLPYVKDVHIKFMLPDKFSIEYEERKPYALVKYVESYMIVDKYGYLLEIVKENQDRIASDIWNRHTKLCSW